MSEPRAAVTIPEHPNVETVRELAARCSNWGRWGPDDELGTLNHILPADIVAASGLVRSGRVFSLSIPLDKKGPQTGGFGRFNPIHLMIPRRQRGRDRRHRARLLWRPRPLDSRHG